MGKLNAGLAAYLAKKKASAGKTVTKGTTKIDKTENKFPDNIFPLKKKGKKKGGK